MGRKMFKDVENVFEDNGYKIVKHEKSRHYIVSKENVSKHIYANMTLGDLIEKVKEVGIEEICLEYDYENIQGRKMSKKSSKVAEKKLQKQIKKSNSEKVKKLKEAKIEIVLDILRLESNERKTEKHYAFRDKLHKINEELQSLL